MAESTSTADNRDPHQHRSIRILSLDGGGIRGLSSLLLLRELMERLGHKGKSLRPCDCFDLIVGTGTGGISALFLGRMRMTVDEAIQEYMLIAKKTFEPTTTTLMDRIVGPMLDSDTLERSVGDTARRFLGTHDAILEDDPESCRTAVLASTSHYADARPYIFRSYATTLPASQFAVKDVACATEAIGGLFPSVLLGNPPIEFINAGLVGYNNPAEVALEEASKIQLGSQIQVACLVSLGTGLQRIVQLGGEWSKLIEVSERLIQDCEKVHHSLFSRLQQEEVPYFRFNVTRGLDVSIQEWSDSEVITGITYGYMRQPEVEHSFDVCVRILNGESLAVKPNNVHQSLGKSHPLNHPAPKIFHGRNDYVEEAITQLLKSQSGYLTIRGPGGMGKTSIALSILHDTRIKAKFGEHCRFVSCEAINSTTLLVDTLCGAFSLKSHSTDRKDDLLRFLMQEYVTKSLLLVLDNFETTWEHKPSEVEELLKVLASVTRISLVLTIRGSISPAGLKWAKLRIVEPLDLAASYKTFVENGGEEDGNLNELLQELDYIPLAITLMSHLGQVESPTQLLERWKTEHTRLLSYSHDQHRLKNVDVSIQLSLDSPRMQHCPSALNLLSVVALLPDGVVNGDLPKICPNIPYCTAAASTLCQTGLAYYDKIYTLRILSPVRAYILENHPPKHSLVDDLQVFYFQLAERGTVNSSDENYLEIHTMLQRSERNMEAVLIEALSSVSGHNNDVKITAAIHWTQFLYKTTPRDAVIQLALKLSQEYAKPNKLNAQCLQSLGTIHYMFDDYSNAINLFSDAKTQFIAINDGQRVAQCLSSLGECHRMLNNYDKACNMLSAAQEEFEELSDKLGVAQCLQALGNIQRVLCQYDNASYNLTTAQKMFKELGYKLGAAQCLQALGNIERMMGNHKKAICMLSDAQAVFKATGYQRAAAQCLISLGDIQRVLENFEKAQEMISAAETIFTQVHDKLGATHALHDLGNIQRILGNHKEAYDMLSTAQTDYEAIDNKWGVAKCLQSLGDIENTLGNPEKAKDMFLKAQRNFEAVKNKRGVAQCFQALGIIQKELQNYEDAKKQVNDALEIHREIDSKQGVAQCLHTLGDIQIMLNNHGDAQEMISTARAQFIAMGDMKKAEQCLHSLREIQNFTSLTTS